ncbi:MAG: HD domain-containing protein, partial [Zoogloea sp.]|nr:HD domain-containing protein [Zoogloea sp.]
MVAVTHSLSASAASALDLLREGLAPDDAARVEQAHDWARGLYGERVLGTREPTWSHALGMALIAASLRLDADTRLAALCFAAGDVLSHPADE